MPILNKDIKKLYSRSAGRCNICSMNLIENDIQIGEMAHIIAKSSNGPRGMQDTIDNSYDNLILLCPTHHTIVDKNPEKYTIEVLKSIKDNYEKYISNRLDINKEYLTDLSTLNTLFKYIPILDFRAMILELPNKISLEFTNVEMFNAFVVDNPHLFPFYDNDLTNKWNIFLEKLNKIDDWVAGTLTVERNRLITFNEMLNGTNTERGYNIYVHDDNGYLVLNKRFLNYEQIELVNKNVSRLVQEFIYAHTELIDYIRYNYKDIEWKEKKNIEEFEDIKTPYDVSKIDILFEPEYVDRLVERYNEKTLNLNPDFQRNEVWKSKQKSRLIESILIKIPIPSFYIDARDESNWIVIDGLQRLSSIIRYINDEYALEDLEFLKDLNGKKFSQIERAYQRRIEDFKLSLYLIRPNTPEEIALNIFTRINTLGEPLSPQEIRHAIYNGKSTQLLKELSETIEFNTLVKPTEVMTRRMNERELILRLLAFKLTNYTEYKKSNNLAMFLANTMKNINYLEDKEINSLKSFFIDSMKKSALVFGDFAFRKIKNEKRNIKRPINKSLFETFGYFLPNYDFEILEKSKDKIVQNLKNRFTDDILFEDSISRSTNNIDHVQYRFNTVLEIIESAIKESNI